MLIKKLVLASNDLLGQRDYYANVLELPVHLKADQLTVQAGKTELVFVQAPANWKGEYHFCFNIPENQFAPAKAWLSARIPLIRDENGRDEFQSSSWNSHSLYFKDATGNILEFIARHDQQNAVDKPFNGDQILQVSEIGLPSKDVIAFAKELCEKLGVTVYRQAPEKTFTPIGDEDGLLILPVEGRIWFPQTGVPAQLLDTKISIEVNGKKFEINRPDGNP
jgi:hypothetical protein